MGGFQKRGLYLAWYSDPRNSHISLNLNLTLLTFWSPLICSLHGVQQKPQFSPSSQLLSPTQPVWKILLGCVYVCLPSIIFAIFKPGHILSILCPFVSFLFVFLFLSCFSYLLLKTFQERIWKLGMVVLVFDSGIQEAEAGSRLGWATQQTLSQTPPLLPRRFFFFESRV